MKDRNMLIDLCAQTVTVRPEGLQRLAEIATHRSLRDCENALSDIHSSTDGCTLRHRIQAQSAARALHHAAKDLEESFLFLAAFESLARGERTSLVMEAPLNPTPQPQE